MSEFHDPANRPDAESNGMSLPAVRRGLARERVPMGDRVPTLRPPIGSEAGVPAVAEAGDGEPLEPWPGVAAPVSNPGPWNRFCTRAAQRWPLILGLGLLLAVPAALYGYARSAPLHAADVRIELEPQRTTAGDPGAEAVPAEALGVAELLQREVVLVRHLAEAADAGGGAGGITVSADPPFNVVARVERPDPAAAQADAEALAAAHLTRTRLAKPEDVEGASDSIAALEAEERAEAEQRTQVRVDIDRARERLAAGGDPAAVLADERAAALERRSTRERLAAARATDRDPLVFLSTLLKSEPAAARAARLASSAGADALAALIAGRGVQRPLDDAAAATAGLVAEVADHRLVDAGPLGQGLVRVSELAAEAEAADAAARAATATAGVAAMERSALQSLRWKQEGLDDARDRRRARIDRMREERAASASLAGVDVTAGSAEPTRDPRPRAALFAGLLGGILGVLGALGWVALDDRVRQDDTRPWEARGVAVLGTVPRVAAAEANGADGPPSEKAMRKAQGEAAALADAVHAVRAMLDGRVAHSVDAEAEGGRTFVVTSTGPGSGKTGLCLGLAASLAAAGERVLLVDAAWADRPDDAEGPGGRQTLEAAAAGMGYLHPEDEDLLAAPDPDQPVGLPAFLAGAPLADSAIETRVGGLSLLPAGPGPLDASRLSGRHIRRLVEAARPTYDVTLVDTSAVSVGLDALFAAAAADGVVLVVSSGERQAAVDRALSRLRTSGATVLGTVLNRVGRPAAPKRSGGGESPAALEGGWQDQGSGMFAAAVGGAVGSAAGASAVEPGLAETPSVIDAAAADVQPAPPSTPRPIDAFTPPVPPAPPAPVDTLDADAGADELDVADVLAGVNFDEDPAPASSSATPEPSAESDLEAWTGQLAEAIASDAADPRPADATGPHAPAGPPAAPSPAPSGEDEALDRLVDRHIEASLSPEELRSGQRVEDLDRPPRA